MKEKKKKDIKKPDLKSDHAGSKPVAEHIGSSNAFEKTEDPLSGDDDRISDELLDEMIGD